MRKFMLFLLLGLLLVPSGCGKGSAAPRRTVRRPAAEAPSPPSGPPRVEDPGDSTASSMPGLKGLSKGAEVIVESVVLDSSPLAVDVPISCLLKVTSFQVSPRIRIEARRFWFEAGKTRIQARPTSSKTPPLPATYLKAGESVSGWLTFEVPRDAKEVILKADLQKPPMDVPITLPEGWDR